MGRRGPIEEYEDWMCDLVLEVASVPGQYQSAMLWEIGKKLGKKSPILPDTFMRWRKNHPELEEAWQASQIISQAIDEKSMMEVAKGERKGNATIFALLANTKYKHEYKQIENQGNNTTINNLTIENLSTKELQYRLERSQEALKRAGLIIDIPSNDITTID